MTNGVARSSDTPPRSSNAPPAPGAAMPADLMNSFDNQHRRPDSMSACPYVPMPESERKEMRP